MKSLYLPQRGHLVFGLMSTAVAIWAGVHIQHLLQDTGLLHGGESLFGVLLALGALAMMAVVGRAQWGSFAPALGKFFTREIRFHDLAQAIHKKSPRPLSTHWTNELFKDHPELFLDALEDRVPQASGEVDVLLRCLGEHGFTPGRVFDLNCGIGRHSFELGKRGIEVLGTDISLRYIDIATQRAQAAGIENKVHFQVADMREITSALEGQEPFDGIVNLWTSFGFYDDETNKDILRHCLQLVRPGGFFAMDIINRDWLVRNTQKDGITKLRERIVLEERIFNLYESRMHNTWSYLKQKDENTFIREKELTFDHRVWSLHELIQLFEEAGWQFMAVYPGMAQQCDTSLRESKQLLVIASK